MVFVRWNMHMSSFVSNCISNGFEDGFMNKLLTILSDVVAEKDVTKVGHVSYASSV